MSDEQRHWLDRIGEQLVQNLSIDREDFDTIPLLQRRMGSSDRAFGGQVAPLLTDINAAVAADPC